MYVMHFCVVYKNEAYDIQQKKVNGCAGRRS